MLMGFSGITIAALWPFLILPFAGLLVFQPLSHFLKHPKINIFYRTGIREVLLLLLAYLLLSLVWGVDKREAFYTWLQFFAVFLGGCLVFESIRQFNHRQKQAMAYALISGVGIAIIMVAINILTNGSLELALLEPSTPMSGGEMEYGTYMFALMIWPCLAYFLMKGRVRLAIAIACATVMILIKMDHSHSIVALMVGAACMALSYFMPRLAVWVFIGMWVGLLVAVPVYTIQMDAKELIDTYEELPVEARYLHIWEVSAKKALEKDPKGAGFSSAGKIPLAAKQTLAFDESLKTIPLPANAIVQLWLELGIIGLIGIWALLLVIFFSWRNVISSVAICKVMAIAQIASVIILPLSFTTIWNLTFLVIVLLSFVWLSICTSAAARNVI
jgi:hypothetical protein